MKKLWCLALLPALLFWNCNPPQSERSKALEEEIESREIKKVSDGEITAAAFQLGQELANKTQQVLGSNLKMALQDSGPQGAIEFCNIQAYPLVDSVEASMDVQIRRTSLKIRNPENEANALETRILQAYQYNHEQGAKLSANVQELEDGYLLYTQPIVIENSLCLNCHGKVGETVGQDTYQLIKELYPADSATGFEKGDLRGMWSIKMARKEIVSRL